MQDYNKENEKAQEPTIYSPEFIPVYPETVKMGLRWIDAIIYGFIRFYLARTPQNSFYFSNKQIAAAIGRPDLSEETISRAIKRLQKYGLILITYQVKANGGKIRFIRLDQKVNSGLTKKSIQNPQKSQIKENKTNENKTKDISNTNGTNEYGKPEINYLLKEIERILGKKLPIKHGNMRHKAKSMYLLLNKYTPKGRLKEDVKWLNDDWKVNLKNFLETVKEVLNKKHRLELNYLDTLYDWLKVWLANGGKELFGIKSPWYSRWLREREVEETRRKLEERATARGGIAFKDKELGKKFAQLLDKVNPNK